MACIGSVAAGAHVYENFMQAGEFAYKDMNYPLATYFYEEAARLVPADSTIDAYVIESRLRDANQYGGKFAEAIGHGKACIARIGDMGMSGSYYMMEDSMLLANIYAKSGDSIAAARCMDGVFGRAPGQKLSGTKRLNLAKLGGLVAGKLGDWPTAESAFELCVAIVEKAPADGETVDVLNMYGNSLYHNHKHEQALQAYRRQRDVCESLYGKDSREYNWASYLIANTLAYMGRIDEGAALYADVIGWYRDRMLDGLREAASTEREKYLDNMIEILQNAIPFGIEAKYDRDEFTATAYECLLLTKGLLLATEMSTDRIIREKGTPEEKAQLDKLHLLSERLKGMCANVSSDPKDVLNAYAEIKTIDWNLTNACRRYGDVASFASVGYDRVRNSLKEDEVLLDFADFKPRSKPRQYVCYEIRRDRKFPKVHYICNGSELDSLLRLENNVWGNLYTGEAGDDLAALIGSRIESIVGSAGKVYYVPSGIFHKLAVEAIPLDGRRLCDSHSFTRLSSARELVDDSAVDMSGDACLYGGLTYGADLKPLGHSRREVEQIAEIMKGVVAPHVLAGEDGTKESFMNLDRDAAKILHFSTHGFYYTPDDKDLPASLRGYDDAMALSGLVMSGGSLEGHTGLLVADEVARRDLSHTAVVCLAACHSGQGETTSEGIYGLQRAFKKAGAGSVVMSLWEVSDAVAECFMTSFYSDLAGGSKDRHKAFDFARNEVRKRYPSPFYWASFAMVD